MWSRIKWSCTSTCFLFVWCVGFLASEIALWLSPYRIVGAYFDIPRSLKSCCSQMSSLAVCLLNSTTKVLDSSSDWKLRKNYRLNSSRLRYTNQYKLEMKEILSIYLDNVQKPLQATCCHQDNMWNTNSFQRQPHHCILDNVCNYVHSHTIVSHSFLASLSLFPWHDGAVIQQSVALNRMDVTIARTCRAHQGLSCGIWFVRIGWIFTEIYQDIYLCTTVDEIFGMHFAVVIHGDKSHDHSHMTPS